MTALLKVTVAMVTSVAEASVVSQLTHFAYFKAVTMASKPRVDPLAVEEEEDHEAERGAERSLASRVPVKVLRAHTDSVTAARFCLDDRCLVSCSSDGSAILWDVQSCSPLLVLDGLHQRAISDCAVMPNGSRIITVSWDKKVAAWDLETGQVLWRWRRAGLLTSCHASSDGRWLVCAADPQNAVYVSDAASGQTLHHLSGHHRSTITRCRFDPQSQRVATVSADRSIKLWDLLAQKTTVSINSNHDNVVSDCCFTENGHFLCTASWDKSLKLWDLQTGGFRSHANLLVSGSYDRTVALWDVSSLCQVLTLKGHSDWVTDVSVSADGKLVASASKDGTVRLWDIENMEKIPEVMEKRTEASGVHMLKCEECENPFPVSRLMTSDLLTRCVFCRLKCPSRYQPQLPGLV